MGWVKKSSFDSINFNEANLCCMEFMNVIGQAFHRYSINFDEADLCCMEFMNVIGQGISPLFYKLR